MIVLPQGVQLPEGAAVKVELLSSQNSTENPPADQKQLDSVWRMGELAVETGIPDLAVNIDHYLYGHPKLKDVQ